MADALPDYILAADEQAKLDSLEFCCFSFGELKKKKKVLLTFDVFLLRCFRVP